MEVQTSLFNWGGNAEMLQPLEQLSLEDLRAVARVSKTGRTLAGLIWRFQLMHLFAHIEERKEFFAKHTDFYSQRVRELLFQTEDEFKSCKKNNRVISYALVVKVCKLYQAMLFRDPDVSRVSKLPPLAIECCKTMALIQKDTKPVLVFKEGAKKVLDLLRALNLYREFSGAQTEIHMVLLGKHHLATLRPIGFDKNRNPISLVYTQARYDPKTGVKVIKTNSLGSEHFQSHALADLVNAIFKPSDRKKNILPHNGCKEFIPLGDVMDFMEKNQIRRIKAEI
ncbi:MAG: hypothetical protein CK425_08145 [Parachlamydia sp.]|nr:MAG: hypothetical protein CK425_08145 [Parachlamydia sp.]